MSLVRRHAFLAALAAVVLTAAGAVASGASPPSKPGYLTRLEAAYGAPSQAGFGSAVFQKELRETDGLAKAALAKFRHFVGPLWERYGEAAWMSGWREVYVRKPGETSGIVAELRGIDDREARSSVEMILDNVEGADAARKAIADAFDGPEVSELRVFNAGDGSAMTGLTIAGRRGGTGETTFLVFLMD